MFLSNEGIFAKLYFFVFGRTLDQGTVAGQKTYSKDTFNDYTLQEGLGNNHLINKLTIMKDSSGVGTALPVDSLQDKSRTRPNEHAIGDQRPSTLQEEIFEQLTLLKKPQIIHPHQQHIKNNRVPISAWQ